MSPVLRRTPEAGTEAHSSEAAALTHGALHVADQRTAGKLWGRLGHEDNTSVKRPVRLMCPAPAAELLESLN